MKKYCSLPWTSKNVKLYNNYERTCCKMQYAPKDKDTERLINIKQSFLNGDQHVSCNACWSEEDQGGKSFRMLQPLAPLTEERIHFLNKQEISNQATLEYIDLEFGYTCNMYCMSCGPFASTTWQKMTNIYPWLDVNDNEDNLENFLELIYKHRNTLKKISLYGGEPSVDPMYYKFINKFISVELPQCDIEIVTNGNYSENFLVKFEDSLRKISSNRPIYLTFSLDAVGLEGEFIRGGLSMERFTKNIKSAISFGFRIRLQISVSLLNIENNIKIIEWAEREDILQHVTIRLNKVSFPEDLSVTVLGNKIKEFLPDWFFDPNRKYPDYYDKMVRFLGSDLDEMKNPDIDKIKRFIKRLDSYASMSPNDIPPYYRDFKRRLEKIIPKSVN